MELFRTLRYIQRLPVAKLFYTDILLNEQFTFKSHLSLPVGARGCYIFYSNDVCLYVGRAKDLKARLTQHAGSIRRVAECRKSLERSASVPIDVQDYIDYARSHNFVSPIQGAHLVIEQAMSSGLAVRLKVIEVTGGVTESFNEQVYEEILVAALQPVGNGLNGLDPGLGGIIKGEFVFRQSRGNTSSGTAV